MIYVDNVKFGEMFVLKNDFDIIEKCGNYIKIKIRRSGRIVLVEKVCGGYEMME